MKKIIFCFYVILHSSCTLKEKEQPISKLYFDLGAYFKSEANRLTNANLQIDKSVMVNGQTEEKKIKIKNWEKEFESFISADINKSSWRGSFNVRKNNYAETYLTENEKIPVKKVEIIYRKDKIYGIKIFITNINRLYTSKDTLIYFPDSLYQIKKIQQIKLMDKKSYQVIGKF